MYIAGMFVFGVARSYRGYGVLEGGGGGGLSTRRRGAQHIFPSAVDLKKKNRLTATVTPGRERHSGNRFVEVSSSCLAATIFSTLCEYYTC